MEGYRTSIVCSFNGYYSLSFLPQTWVLLPQSQAPIPSFDCNCNCLVEIKEACSTDTAPNECCRFHLVINCTPYLNNSDTMFFCTNNHSDDTAKTLMGK